MLPVPAASVKQVVADALAVSSARGLQWSTR